MLARDLHYPHVGERVSWAIPDPDALFPAETPVGDLCWISHTEGAVVLGVTFCEPVEDGESTRGRRILTVDGERFEYTSDDYWLHPDTEITIHPEEDK